MEAGLCSIFHFIAIISLILLALNLLSIFIYCIPIISVQHLRTKNNLITVNVCLAMTLCILYWAGYFSFELFFICQSNYKWTASITYIRTTVNCQAAFSLCVLSIYRFCTIVYGQKRWFNKRRSMILSVISQWIMCFLLPVPILYLKVKV